MAVINKYATGDEVTIAPVTLDGTDTAALTLNGSSTLYVTNATGADVTLIVLGDTATSKAVPGIGDVDLTGGLEFDIPDGEEKSIPLNTKYKYWLGDGNLTITGGTGCTAYIVEG